MPSRVNGGWKLVGASARLSWLNRLKALVGEGPCIAGELTVMNAGGRGSATAIWSTLAQGVSVVLQSKSASRMPVDLLRLTSSVTLIPSRSRSRAGIYTYRQLTREVVENGSDIHSHHRASRLNLNRKWVDANHHAIARTYTRGYIAQAPALHGVQLWRCYM